MKIMKKIFALAAAVSLVCLSSVGAMAANKLIVKDSTGITDKFVVTDQGYVGIGSAPATPLMITGNGDPGLSAFYMFNYGRATGATVNDSPGINFFRNNDATVNAGGLPRNGDRLGYFGFGSKVSGANRWAGIFATYAEGTWGSLSNPGYVVIQTTTSGSTSPTEKVRITSAGNIGIGTATPQSKLDVSGGIRIGTSAAPVAGNCTSTTRGTLWVQQATTDVLWICAQSGAGSFVWRSVALNP